ncbi:MAG TPA: hypothetical protein VNJ52_00950 [Patescibacteria group bacterium]|nr:hypothetical protein [Patescibacteria group bacterium]
MLSRSRIVSFFSVFFAAGLLSFMLVPGARASAWNQKTLVTVNGPVEIPGHVLSPGTYTFRLIDSISGSSIVAITNAETGKLITYALAEPAFRPNVTAKPVVTLEERPSNSPPALLKWFYPGDEWGQKFIYAHSAPRPMAALAHKTASVRG